MHQYILLIATAALLSACGKKVAPSRVEHQAGEPLPTGAALVTATNTLMTGRVDVVGTLVSAERVQVSARLPAYVREVRASAGQRVQAGDTLVLLDDREIQEQLLAAQAQADQADSELKRTQQLFDKGAATDQMLVAARSGAQAARAQVERTKVMLSYATVTAPISGVVTERKIEPGDLANPGQVLLSLYNPAKMRLETPVPVRLVPALRMGQRVEVTIDALARTFPGEVTEIVSEIDPMSRTQTVKIHLDQGDTPLLPGTFGRVWVDEAPRLGMLLPKSAVYRVGQLEMVHVAEGSRMVTRMVRTGGAVGDQIEILSGLRDGDVVVRSGDAS